MLNKLIDLSTSRLYELLCHSFYVFYWLLFWWIHVYFPSCHLILIVFFFNSVIQELFAWTIWCRVITGTCWTESNIPKTWSYHSHFDVEYEWGGQWNLLSLCSVLIILIQKKFDRGNLFSWNFCKIFYYFQIL